MRVVAISDTHGQHGKLRIPEGDVLIHAGDFSNMGKRGEVESFSAFVDGLTHPHKLVVPGNHDLSFEDIPDEARGWLRGCTLLQDSGVTIDGVRFWGSPWQPWFLDWAFNLKDPAELAAKWALIPDDTDVLITHGPPKGVLDRTVNGDEAGCAELRARVEALRPRVHVFGHIHEGAGEVELGGVRYVNACSTDVRCRAVHPPIVFDL